MILNDDIVFVEPADGMARSIPFTVKIWFNKIVDNYKVSVKVDTKTVNPNLITLTEETQPTHWKHHKGTRGLENVTTTYYILSFDHYFGEVVTEGGTTTYTGESVGRFTLTYDTATEEGKTFTFDIWQQSGDYYNV